MRRFLGSSEISTSRSKENDSLETCLIALGSNLDDPISQVQDGIQRLKNIGEIVATSSLYSSPALPEGPPNQADYINAVVKLRTSLDPSELLLAIKHLNIPHQEMMNRPFVLQPLLDVSPEWKHPQTGISAASALDVLRPFELNRKHG